MKMVIFSDIHYSDNYKYENEPIKSRKLTMYSEPLVKKLIEKINHEIKPDIVLNLGDLIEDRNDSKKDKENLEYIWNILKQIKVPLYENITDAPYINRVKNEYQMVFTNVRYTVGLVGTSIGLYFAGIMYNYGITFNLGLSAFFVLFQLLLAYYSIYLRKKEKQINL